MLYFFLVNSDNRYPAEMHMVFLKEGYTTKETASEDADGAAALAFFLEASTALYVPIEFFYYLN